MPEEMHEHPSVPSRFSAIIKGRCPKCRKGSVFISPPYSLHFQKMHSACPVCGQDFEIEPGFYYGSMYFSYALTVLLGLFIVIGSYFLLSDPPVWVYLSILLGVLILLSPILFRFSRLLMLHWFGGVRYKK
jgi:uncharacterized protein (DUF983 family)